MPSDAVLREMAPTGRLRAAINFGNTVLAQTGEAGAPQGITVDLAREISARMGLGLDLVPFEAAGKVFEALKSTSWDIAFLAVEPVRAAELEFTAPYVILEGTYMVSKDSTLKKIADVDRPGVRIAVGRGSAYDLFLTRTIKHATVVPAHAGGPQAMIELFLRDKLEAVAGVRGWLVDHAAKDSNVRVMDGSFMQIEQAVAVPKGRMAAADYLRGFVEEVKASGFVAEALRRSGQTTQAEVAPPA